MGLIDKFKEINENRREKAIAKNLKTLRNPKAIKEDRVAAIDFFKSFEDIDIAIPALLMRFDYSLEHGINDTREKESAMEGIKKFGEPGLSYVLDHLKKSFHIAWPLKIYSSLANEDQLIEALEACLDHGDVAFDQNKVDKNYDILCYLRAYKLKDHGRKLFHFLKEHDERLRFAAAEVLLEQEDEDNYLELEQFIPDDSAENIRIRQVIMEKFADIGRTIRDQKTIKPGPLVSGFFVTKKYKIQSRN